MWIPCWKREWNAPFDYLYAGLFDDDAPLYGRHAKKETEVDMQPNENGYTILIGLPDFRKDQINLDLENGCLTVTAEKHQDRNKRNVNGRLIYQERFTDRLSVASKPLIIGIRRDPSDRKPGIVAGGWPDDASGPGVPLAVLVVAGS